MSFFFPLVVIHVATGYPPLPLRDVVQLDFLGRLQTPQETGRPNFKNVSSIDFVLHVKTTSFLPQTVTR